MLIFNISMAQNFPGGVSDSDVWHYPNFSSQILVNYSNNSPFGISTDLEFQEGLFNFNESYYSSDQLRFISQLINELSYGKDIFLVSEYEGNGEEFGYALGHTNWTDFYIDQNLGFVQKNDLGLSTKYAELYEDGVPMNLGQTTINNFHWNNYAKSRIYNSYGFNGETIYNIGQNFSFNANNSSVENFAGYIPEIIIFPFEVSKNEQNRVESYLALKYGISLLSDYKSSRNILVWNKEGSFSNRIFGLGKDNVSGLNQLISESRSFQNDLVASVGSIAETNQIKQEETFIENNHFLVFGDSGGELQLNEHRLTQREADVLRLLAIHSNEIVKRESILKNIWGEDDYFHGRSLDVFISRLRKYLSADTEVVIENIHSVGFKLKC